MTRQAGPAFLAIRRLQQRSDALPSGVRMGALLDVINEAERPGSDLVTPFEALLSGALVGHRQPATVQRVNVLAVLERTAVVSPARCLMPRAGDRALARIFELFVDPAAINWKSGAQELRFGHHGKVSARARRRCPRCGRLDGETEFRAYRTSYCVPCTREVAREHRRRRAALGTIGKAA